MASYSIRSASFKKEEELNDILPDNLKKIIKDKKEQELQKEILYIKKDLKQILKEEKRYKLVINIYKKKGEIISGLPFFI